MVDITIRNDRHHQHQVAVDDCNDPEAILSTDLLNSSQVPYIKGFEQGFKLNTMQ
jgi:hypothetical protein